MKILKIIVLSLFSTAALAVAPQLPDHKMTPGVVNPEATKDIICKPNYTSGVDVHGKKVRNVPQSLKKKVFEEYKLDPKSDKFEIDHLISLELGGKNDIKNLWAQSYTTKPYNAHTKDALENKLHKMVCSGTITLQEAQTQISTNWIEAYKKYVK